METLRKLSIAFLVFLLAFCFGCKKSGEPQKEAAANPEEAQPSEPVESSPEELKSEAPADASPAGAPEKITVQLFVMSYCPYGITAENSIAKTLKALKDYVNFELHFVVGEMDGTIQSLHGQKEVDMNAAQICVGKIAPDKQMDFIVEFNKNTNQPWQDAAKKLGISENDVKNCLDSGYGLDVQKEDAKLCERLNVQGSPTLIIDGQRYQGGRSSKHFFDAFCQMLERKGKKPSVCDAPPDYLSYEGQPEQPGSCGDAQGGRVTDDKPYNLIIVYPEDALWPIDAHLKNLLEQTFPKSKIDRVSDKSPQGKEFLKKTGLNKLPAVVSTTPEFAKNKLVENGTIKVQSKSGLYFLSPDDFGANYYLDVKPVNDVFAVYYRADSARVKNIVPEIMKILKQNSYQSKKTKIYIRPFLKVSGDEFASEGGEKAIEESRRELVVAEEWLDSFDIYLQSLAGDYSNWETAAKNAGITPAVLLEKALSGDTNSSLMNNSEQWFRYGLPDTLDLLFVYRACEMVLVRNPQEFDQFMKRLP